MAARKPAKSLADVLGESDGLIRRRDWKAQEALLREALKRFPAEQELCYRYAVAVSESKPTVASDYALRAVDLGGSDPVLLTKCAALMYEMGDITNAARTVQRVLGLMPDDFELVADVLHLIGKISALKGEDELAEESLRRAFDADPGAIGHARELAALLARRGDRGAALDVISRGLEHVPEDGRLLAELRHEIERTG
jgi:tetratricopeptide (TPR) repeat protein